PALIFLGFGLDYWRIAVLALIGGCLGVCFMIPLRRQLIVKEHGNLLYPEGTACAEVLIAGFKGGSVARRCFSGLGPGALYSIFQNENNFAAWPSTPTYNPAWLPGGSMRAIRQPSISAWDTSSVRALPACCSPAACSRGSWSCRQSSSSVRTSRE